MCVSREAGEFVTAFAVLSLSSLPEGHALLGGAPGLVGRAELCSAACAVTAEGSVFGRWAVLCWKPWWLRAEMADSIRQGRGAGVSEKRHLSM